MFTGFSRKPKILEHPSNLTGTGHHGWENPRLFGRFPVFSIDRQRLSFLFLLKRISWIMFQTESSLQDTILLEFFMYPLFRTLVIYAALLFPEKFSFLPESYYSCHLTPMYPNALTSVCLFAFAPHLLDTFQTGHYLPFFLELFQKYLSHQVAGLDDLGIRYSIIDVDAFPPGKNHSLRF